MRQRTLEARRLGRMSYEEALEIQKATERDVRDHLSSDTLLLVEHPHTITLGRRANHSAIMASEDALRARGVEVFESNRGGRATYHGLGQVVGYPIVNLSPDREDVHAFVRDLEEVLMRVLNDFGIESFRIKGLTGVHTTEGKVAAIGIHIARWVTTHGFALNVNTDLNYFKMILPCKGEPVASMNEIAGREFDLREVEDRITARFAEVFDMTIAPAAEDKARSRTPLYIS